MITIKEETNNVKILGNTASLSNIPWQEQPEGCSDILWRYSLNPIIKRDHLDCSNSIFNSAVIPFGDGFAGVFRVDSKCREMRIHKGFSKDGIDWDIDSQPIEFVNSYPDIDSDGSFNVNGYDPRLCEIDGRYYISWCKCHNGPTVAISYTDDFEHFFHMESAFLPFNRNGVLFPRKINGKFAMLSRPSDNGHTAFGNIYYSESPDLIHWGCHRPVMRPRQLWEETKIGAGPTPIETSEGWLLIYHGVLTSCNGYVYSIGAAILDLDEPWKVKYRCKPYLLSPQMSYECVGDVPNVVFPCAALVDSDTNKLAVYYGCADTVTGLAFAKIDELLFFIKKNSEI